MSGSSKRLEGRVAIVTGAGQGIGAAVASAYAREGARVALGRFGTPEDIAPLATFLASDEGDYITGQTIGADGGSTML